MASLGVMLAALLVACFVFSSYANVLFSNLPPSLVVVASPKSGQVLKVGEDNITVTWRLNNALSSASDSSFKTIKVKLCYAPVSQRDRAWRKTEDHLKKDKTCQFDIVSKPYTASGNKTYEWVIERDVPTATYFVRAYAYNSDGDEVAYGQTTDSHKTTNLFDIQAITGQHVSLDICAVCFSAFSVVSLFGFFFNEKRKSRRQQK